MANVVQHASGLSRIHGAYKQHEEQQQQQSELCSSFTKSASSTSSHAQRTSERLALM